MARKRNHSLGKFLVGAAVIGVAAYGVYRVIKRRKEILEAEEADSNPDFEVPAEQQNPGRTVCGEEEEAGTEEFGNPESGTEETSASEDGAEDSGTFENRYASVNFRQAADRAYTTIQHSSQEALDRVIDAVGPKGSEVLATVGEAAGEVGRTVASSAARIIDILAEPEPEYYDLSDEAGEAENVSSSEPSPDPAPVEDAAVKTTVFVDETESSGSASSEDGNVQNQAVGSDGLCGESAQTAPAQSSVETESYLDEGAGEMICAEPLSEPAADPVEDFFDESDAL